MTTDEFAVTRDAEVARLHPGTTRKHVRATLPARVVLRAVEQHEGDERVPLVGKTALTAAVDARGVRFYSGADPVQEAGWIDAADITAVRSGTEVTSLPPGTRQVLRLEVAGVGTHPLDVDLELVALVDGELEPVGDVADEITSWAALLGRS